MIKYFYCISFFNLNAIGMAEKGVSTNWITIYGPHYNTVHHALWLEN